MRLDAAATVGRHVIGKHRIEQQRHMAEQVVEHVRFGDVVDLVGTTDPPSHRKAPIGQMLEEIKFRQETFDPDQLPTSGLCEQLVDLLETWNLLGRHAEEILVLDELGAGTTLEHLALAHEQGCPGGVILFRIAVPWLIDNRGRIDRHKALVGQLVFDAARFGRHDCNPFSTTVHANRFGAQEDCELARK